MCTLIVDGGTCGENLTWKLYDEVIIIKGTGDMDDYDYMKKAQWNYSNRNFFRKVIIEEGVTSIGDYAFAGCKNLEEIIIPDSITYIGTRAFRWCENLTKIKIPDSVRDVGEDIFSDCTRLTENPVAKLLSGICGENLTWNIDYEGTLIICGKGEMENYSGKQEAPWFKRFLFIRKVVIEDGITSIGECAFIWCVNLKTVAIPASITSIGADAFSWCATLTAVKIPNSVTVIGSCAFSDCKGLREITIPDSVTKIGGGVFAFCPNLKEIYYPADSDFKDALGAGNYAELISYGKLFWKVEDKTLTIGGVREIKNYSYDKIPWFESLNLIQKIVIEEGVEKISANAFSECTRLEQLTITASVKTIGDLAFTYCYCGERTINNGRNVTWSLEDGILMIKKNPAAKSDFSTGYETWQVVEKNIKSVKVERGVVPGKRFFD